MLPMKLSFLTFEGKLWRSIPAISKSRTTVSTIDVEDLKRSATLGLELPQIFVKLFSNIRTDQKRF